MKLAKAQQDELDGLEKKSKAGEFKGDDRAAKVGRHRLQLLRGLKKKADAEAKEIEEREAAAADDQAAETEPEPAGDSGSD